MAALPSHLLLRVLIRKANPPRLCSQTFQAAPKQGMHRGELQLTHYMWLKSTG